MANPTATFETSMGSFKVEIFLEEMPITAENFISLAKSGFYDGLHFHRVIKDFMILRTARFRTSTSKTRSCPTSPAPSRWPTPDDPTAVARSSSSTPSTTASSTGSAPASRSIPSSAR